MDALVNVKLLPSNTAKRAALSTKGSICLMVASIVLLLALQSALIFTRTINWDEFFFYSQIEIAARGESLAPLQTLHVRLLSWMPSLPGNVIDHIIAGRLIMFAAEFVTLASIYGIASRISRDLLTSDESKSISPPSSVIGLACVLIYLSSGYILQQGFSFRTDPLAAALLMSALWILTTVRNRIEYLFIFAMLAGAAPLITVKAVLYFPAFLGIGWLRLQKLRGERLTAWWLATAVTLSVIVFASLYLWHSDISATTNTWAGATEFTDRNAAHTGRSRALLSEAASRMFDLGGMRYGGFLRAFALEALPFVIVCALSLIGLTVAKIDRNQKIAIAGLLATATAFVYYRNSLPYFYPFILAPVAAGCVIGVAVILRRYSPIGFSMACVAVGIFVYSTEDESRIGAQRQLQVAIAHMFPSTIDYIDFPAMFGQHRKVNGFLTLWGVEGYLEGPPIYGSILDRRVVPLLVLNDAQFNRSISDAISDGENAWTFHKADREVFIETYQPFWGPFWLAGVTIDHGSKTHRIRVPGVYLMRQGELVVDGQILKQGDVITLDRGLHMFTNNSSRTAKLTWGEDTKMPDFPAPLRPYWTDF